MIVQSIFKNKKVIWKKLVPWGFVSEKNSFLYTTNILNGQFKMIIHITAQGEVKTNVYDTDTGDEYVLHLMDTVEGAFVGKMRDEYSGILQKLADECFEKKIFKSSYSDKIINYIRDKYQDEFEFLWEKFSENAIVRRKDNKKWYALLLTVAKNKIGLSGDEKVEILDLRMKTEDIEALVGGKKYFPGYHMNKKHWVTVCLDGSVKIDEIFQKIDESYLLAKK